MLDKPIWNRSTHEQRLILITILLLANHKEEEWEWNGQRFKCHPGQFVTSLPSLASKADCSIQNIRTALKRFKKYEFLTDQPTPTGRLITVVNWDKYQAKDDDLTDQSTDSQQTPNRPLTPNKNDKNDKNDKKNIYTPEFENWYSFWPRPDAKADSFKNFEKRRKEHGLDFILQCSQNYINYLDSFSEEKKPFPYQSNNFFGQKAYYLDFVQPKFSDKVKPINPNRAALDRMT